MLFYQLTCTVAFAVSLTMAAVDLLRVNPTSEISDDEIVKPKANTTMDVSAVDDSGHEEIDIEEIKDKKFLDDAMRTVLDPNTIIVKNDDIQHFKMQLNEIDGENMTLTSFMESMDKLSLEVCKTSQEALWAYVTHINDETKKNKMVRVAAEEDEIKKQYWNILKTKYLRDTPNLNGSKLSRKIHIIKERGTNVQMPQSKQREEIDTMQRIWSRVSVCAYNSTVCSEDSVRTMSVYTSRLVSLSPKTSSDDGIHEELRELLKNSRETYSDFSIFGNKLSICIQKVAFGEMELVQKTTDGHPKTGGDIITIFKTSNDSKELAYYWKAYRDSTGKKIRPIFKDYVMRMNRVAESENFTDAGDMWRYAFEDDNFVENVDRMWKEIKPFYDLLHDYVRAKLKVMYKEDLQGSDNLIPAHILGNLWAQEWQAIYPLVAAYPEEIRPKLERNETLHSKDLFDAVDEFHQSLGFESAIESYQGITDTMATANCLPSSHDMCDGSNYRIKWCGERITDVAVGLSRAARLLGHVQYFKHYRHLSPLYRDGPNPAFHDAISDIVAVQLTSPNHLKTLSFLKVETSPRIALNHLLWVALEKLPLMAYAYVLDKWRWDVFGNSSIQNWNEHWWNLRIKETGVSPPVPRNETDLDPAAKYHVVSHVQYVTLVPLSPKSSYDDGIHEELRELLKNSRETYSDFSIFGNKPSICIQKVAFGAMELVQKTKDGHPKTGGGKIWQSTELNYLVSHILEFQLLLALCKSANHSGPLHECSIYGQQEAGNLLSTGMSLGASQDWRTVLQAMTGETELSTKGFLEYFSTLRDFLKEENIKLAKIIDDGDMDQSAPIIVGVVVLCLTLLIVLMYCIKKHSGTNVLSMCGLSKNGSLDIVTNEAPQGKTNEIEGIVEDKV